MDMRDTRMIRRAGPILLVVAASTAVAVGAAGGGLFLPPAELGGGSLRAVRLGAVCAAVVAMAVLLLRGRWERSSDERFSDRTGAALGSAATIMAVIAAMAFAGAAFDFGRTASQGAEASDGAEEGGRSGPRLGLLPPSTGMGAAGGGSGNSRTRGRGDGGTGRNLAENTATGGGSAGGALASGALDLLLLALIAGAAVLAFRMLNVGRAETGEEDAGEPPVSVPVAEASLEASLADVAYDGPDPRRQITAAYVRLLVALADAGVPRLPQEAPHEYLHRALGPLGVQPLPMHRLTGLYVTAQFSAHPITERHRVEAVESLEAGLASLRSSGAASGRTGGVREAVAS
jgi:hypothetical protein